MKDHLAIVTGQIYIHEGKKCCEIVKVVTDNEAESFDYMNDEDFIDEIETDISEEGLQYWFTAIVKVITEEVRPPFEVPDFEDTFYIHEVKDVQQAFELISTL